MILTPHFNKTLYDYLIIEKQFKLLKDLITKKDIKIKIYLGNEIYLNEESVEGIKTGQAHTMADSKYLLLELPHYHFYPFHENLIYDLQLSGYKILLAHVERYQIFEKKTENLKEMVKNNIYSQITSSFIVNKKTRSRALNLIESGLIHIVASDGHDIEKRPPVMKSAFNVISTEFGESCAQSLFVDNPRLMIEDHTLKAVTKKRLKRFNFWIT